MEYYPEVIHVIPTDDYKVYIYFDDGRVKLFDASDLVEQGVFKQLKDKKVFIKTCKVLNKTLAWDINENYSPSDCLDLDPLELYRSCPDTEEPSWLFKSIMFEAESPDIRSRDEGA
ncbi:MAG: DUF2442 domain-containing protein [Desulfosporosinus sp.]|nr:DUF2442 domain-containing protein [Desulfosporosinus sp.]